MPCGRAGHLCVTWFNTITVSLSLASLIVYTVGFAVGLAKLDPPEPLSARHFAQMTLIVGGFLCDFCFLWTIYTDKLIRTMCYTVFLLLMASLWASGGCLAIAASVIEACSNNDPLTKFLSISNLGGSCEYAFVAFIGAFFYGLFAVIKVYMVAHLLHRGGATKMKDAELDGVAHL